jgi:hypothetical protein
MQQDIYRTHFLLFFALLIHGEWFQKPWLLVSGDASFPVSTTGRSSLLCGFAGRRQTLFLHKFFAQFSILNYTSIQNATTSSDVKENKSVVCICNGPLGEGQTVRKLAVPEERCSKGE